MRGLDALLGILGQARLDQSVEGRRRHRAHARDRGRLALQDRGDQRRVALGFERLLAGGHLVEDGAEGEQVGASVGLLPLELLGRHVLERAHHRALRRERMAHGRRMAQAAWGGTGWSLAGEPEVEQLRPRLGDHDVPGLEVSMDDPRPVGAVERVGDLDPVAEHVRDGERAALEARRQRLPLQQLHDQVVHAVLVPDVVERADVGVVERRSGAGFALEARLELGGIGERLGEHLDRHLPVEAGVPRAIDLAHAACSERRHDFIRPEFRSRGQGHDAGI